MQIKIFFYFYLLCMGSAIMHAMNFDMESALKDLNGESLNRYALGSLFTGAGAAGLVCCPENGLFTNMMCSGCCMVSLQSYFKDVPFISSLKNKICFSLIGASIVAAQTRDANRGTIDHIRALCAGGLLASGLSESIKKILHHDNKGASLGIGLCALGALLLSQKDIKSFFGFQKGYSLNPALEVKDKIKEMRKTNRRSCRIHRATLRCAQAGRIQAQPFFFRIVSYLFSKFKQENNDQTPVEISVPELELVMDILPYLRTLTEPTKIEKYPTTHLVFSVNSNVTVGLSHELARDYLTLETYWKLYKE